MIPRFAQTVLVTLLLTFAVNAQQSTVAAGSALHEVNAVQVQPTVIANPDRIKEPAAASLVQDSLQDAFRHENIQIGDNSQVHAHVVLDEFTSGSVAKRMTVGFGTGRSSIACHLVLQDASGKELANVPIHVRGNKAFNGYEGNGTQRRQALSSLDHEFEKEIEKLK